ncbi:restriction endonuclease subunit S [Pseudodesulfovibrio pelocollis]|uniref:restriction endonuclease subunit S n=1 Tax=Pseudodesulfovibrio pelocollis TaxID=3051432 RepID=UPI00255A88B0|nr:restriction endonuclease subunit S [Pseudodesulfovibrio sp. SB368]
MGKYRAYPEYRDSGVEWLGEVPKHWKRVRVKNVATLNPSKSAVRGLPEDMEVSFLPMDAVGEQGELDLAQSKLLGAVIDGYTYVGEGDVIIAKITPCFENGKGAVAKSLKNGMAFATTEVIPLRCHNERDRQFLYYLLSSPPFRPLAEGSMYGAGGQKRVSDNFVANYSFAQPSEEERTQIATFLDRETAKIDRLIDRQEQLIELLKEKRQAVISHAVTKGLDPDAPMKDSGVEWLGEIPAHWEVVQLGHVAISMQTGPFGSQLHAEDYCEGGTPVINPAHMVDGKICPDEKCAVDEEMLEQLAHHQLRAQDIVFARRGELGRCALVTDHESGWLCGTGSVKVTLNMSRLAPKFLLLFMGTSSARDALSLMSKGSTMENLNTEILGKLKIPLPQMDEQVRIVGVLGERLKKIALLREKVESAIALLQERRTALISASVTGKIDVRVAV